MFITVSKTPLVYLKPCNLGDKLSPLAGRLKHCHRCCFWAWWSDMSNEQVLAKPLLGPVVKTNLMDSTDNQHSPWQKPRSSFRCDWSWPLQMSCPPWTDGGSRSPLLEYQIRPVSHAARLFVFSACSLDPHGSYFAKSFLLYFSICSPSFPLSLLLWYLLRDYTTSLWLAPSFCSCILVCVDLSSFASLVSPPPADN